MGLARIAFGRMKVPAIIGMAALASSLSIGGTTAGKLELTAHLSRSDVVVYEPVVLTWALANHTDSPIRTRANVLQAYGDVLIEIGFPDGSRTRYDSGVHADAAYGGSDPEGAPLEPGDALEGVHLISRNTGAGGLAFPNTGRYEIRVSVADRGPQKSWYRAPTIELHVGPPSEADRVVLDHIGGPDALVSLVGWSFDPHCEGPAAATCYERLRAVAEDNLGSAYAPYVLYGIGSAMEAGHLELNSGFDLKLDLFDEILDRWPTHPLRRILLPHVAAILVKAGRRSQALRRISQAEREFPYSRRVMSLLRSQLPSEKSR